MEVVLKTTKREFAAGETLSSKRKAGLVPANFYGFNVQNQSFFVDEMELLKAVKAGAKVITLDTEDGLKKCVIRELQRHPVTWKIRHVDMFALTSGREVELKVPVRYSGVSFGVKNMGGVLIMNSRSLRISCLPEFIPNEIVVDVSPMKLKDTVHASDINMDNVRVLSAKSTLLCRVAPTRASLSEFGGDKGSGKTKKK